MKSRRRYLIRAIGFGEGGFATATAPTVSAEPGINDGEVDLTVVTLPQSWGDAVEAGDGLGTIGILRWFNSIDGWQTLSDPAQEGMTIINFPPELWGLTLEIPVQGVSAGGLPGRVGAVTVTVPGTTMVLDTLVMPNADPITNQGDPMTVYIPA